MTSAITEDVHSLCTDLDRVTVEAQMARSEVSSLQATRTRLESDNNRLREESIGARRKQLEAENVAIEWKRLSDVGIEQRDRVTTELGLYLVELEGHRDTAKTKAEGIVIGHVVERLKAIRDLATPTEQS